jgi:hypothetical protein
MKEAKGSIRRHALSSSEIHAVDMSGNRKAEYMKDISLQ